MIARPRAPALTRAQRYRRVMESLIIRTEHRDLVPMRFSQSQEILWSHVAPILNDDLPLRIIVLKARQIYSSTFWQALMFTHTIANHGVHSLVIAQDVPTAHELLDMALRFNEHLPMPAIAPARVSELIFPFARGASRYRVQSAKVTGRGRGANWTCVHNSEVPYWPNPEIAVGVRQAVPDEPGTIWVMESTPNGKSGLGAHFYHEWLAAVSGDSDMMPIFISWITMRKYRRSPGLPPDDWDEYERRIASTFGGPRGLEYPSPSDVGSMNTDVIGQQLAWRRWAIKNRCKGSRDIFNQEFPLTPDVAFLSSGTPAFDYEGLLLQHKHVQPPVLRGEMREGTFVPVDRGAVRVWQEPIPGHPYVIGADTAEGLVSDSERAKDTRDYAAAVVLDMRTLEQVASVHGHIQPWHFADVLAELGNWYNRALLAVEINNHGHTTNGRLIHDLHYGNLYRWRGKPDRDPRLSINKRIYGWECVDPDARILTADLQWVSADSLKVGDLLIGCEERAMSRRVRRLQYQRVDARQTFLAPLIIVTLADGRRTRVSSTHPFLVKLRLGAGLRWVFARDLCPGMFVKGLRPWEPLHTYEAGRLSAFLDGEGHLAQGTKGNLQLLISQAEGPLANEIRDLWELCGFRAPFKWVRHKKRPREKPVAVCGVLRLPDVLRALGTLRPTRLRRRFAAHNLERLTVRALDHYEVVAVEPDGDGPVIGLTTNPGHTLIADGLVGHNTNSYSRPLMIDAGRRVLNTDQVVLREEKLIEELTNFSMMDNGKYEAEYGHDDRVVALLIALRAREENYVEVKQPVTLSEPDLRGVRVMDHRDIMNDAARRKVHLVLHRAERAVTSYLQL